MKRFIPILDPGHAGMRLGIYATPGKRSPKYEGNPVLYEGAFNRAIVNRIKERCDLMEIPYAETVSGSRDMPLWERCLVANNIGAEIREMGNLPYFISIHSNAGGGTGFEVWTSPGETSSDYIATMWVDIMTGLMPGEVMRKDMSDGDPDKENKFKVLMGTRMPAILTENLFMDNKEDFCKLISDDVREVITDAHIFLIKKLYNEGTKLLG